MSGKRSADCAHAVELYSKGVKPSEAARIAGIARSTLYRDREFRALHRAASLKKMECAEEKAQDLSC